ncbi:monofunctional biosynthetic peptidoglycan transglycosylase [Plastorhodobacter daqingensis]|uniref:Biosynthetic peptidoglycan transglycosylase n=1 Tax=Plastorhodobacter daqingensis TaxID=1387281 RepID=A0ABW2UFF7_9RHOB
MARSGAKTRARSKGAGSAQPLWRRGLRWLGRGLGGFAAVLLLLILVFAVVPPPPGIYMLQESRRLGGIQRDWVPMDRISPHMQRAAVAAEDANFCLHWGFDMNEIRRALDQGRGRGASTISQQVVKNVFLWHGRTWFRKAPEAVLTPVVETFWSKRRILEVYLNVAEFDTGVFGVEAAARHYFGTDAASLSPTQAARLAMVLPNPKERSASRPTDAQRRRTAAILDGAATIRADGRSACFEG